MLISQQWRAHSHGKVARVSQAREGCLVTVVNGVVMELVVPWVAWFCLLEVTLVVQMGAQWCPLCSDVSHTLDD